MSEYLIKYEFSLKTETPESFEALIKEASPELNGFLITDLKPSEVDQEAIWAARNNFEETHTPKMIWYVENLTVSSLKVID
jgi:hypothetical protein